MPIDRDHAFADGEVFGPPTNAFQRWRVARLMGPHAPAEMRAHHAWLRFIRFASIDRSSRLGPNAWCVNHSAETSAIEVRARAVCRGLLRIEKFGAGRITLGSDSYIGDDCLLSSAAGIDIGAHALIAHGVQIFDNDSHPLDSAARLADYASVRRQSARAVIASVPVAIGEHAWIGFNAIIVKGVTVGRNAIVAAGSVVTRDVPEAVVVAGNPAVVVKELGAENV